MPELPIRALTREERTCAVPDCNLVREVDSLNCYRHRQPRLELEAALWELREAVGPFHYQGPAITGMRDDERLLLQTRRGEVLRAPTAGDLRRLAACLPKGEQ